MYLVMSTSSACDVTTISHDNLKVCNEVKISPIIGNKQHMNDDIYMTKMQFDPHQYSLQTTYIYMRDLHSNCNIGLQCNFCNGIMYLVIKYTWHDLLLIICKMSVCNMNSHLGKGHTVFILHDYSQVLHSINVNNVKLSTHLQSW